MSAEPSIAPPKRRVTLRPDRIAAATATERSAAVVSHVQPTAAARSSVGDAAGTTAAAGIAGAGLCAAIVVFAVAGLADGAASYLRAPAASRGASLLGGTLAHCTGVLVSVGFVVGLLQEAVLRAAARRASLRRAARFLYAGPRRWFAPDPVAARRGVIAAVGAAGGVALVFAVASHVVAAFHAPMLMATAVALAVPLAFAASFTAAVVLAWPLERALARAGRAASPGLVALACALAAAVPLVRFARRHWVLFGNLGAVGLALAAFVAVAVLDLAAVAALGYVGLRRGRGARTRSVALLCAAACVPVAHSAVALGRQQVVLSTVLLRSVGTRYLVAPLQHAVDRDRDGYGALFGGGDCDDGDARIHPDAVEIAGNGIDDNCSGADRPLEPPPPPPPLPASNALAPGGRPARRPSVLIFSIDAARPDHMSAYGYGRETTPYITRFAERAARFANVYSTSPQSLRSFSAVFTGRYPADVAWGNDAQFPALDPANTTLAETLRHAGYTTAAFVNSSYFSLTPGFFQGFELVHESTLFKDEEWPVVRRAAAWLDERRRAEEPFFAWVHMINAHAPYGDHASPREFGHSEVDRYDEEIARADAAFAQVLAAVDAIERDGQPVALFVLSDHGEGFGEHGHYFHSFDLHDEALRVALLVRAPGTAPGVRRGVVSLLDVHATVLDLVGQRAAGDAGPSRSLAPLLASAAAGARAVDPFGRDGLLAEVSPTLDSSAALTAMIAPPWKLIHDVEHNAWELYNLASDPREQRNAYDDDPGRAAQLRARLLDRARVNRR